MGLAISPLALPGVSNIIVCFCFRVICCGVVRGIERCFFFCCCCCSCFSRSHCDRYLPIAARYVGLKALFVSATAARFENRPCLPCARDRPRT